MNKFYAFLLLSCTLSVGALAQLSLVKPMQLYSYMYPVGNQILFFGNGDADPFSTNYELWTTDGTAAGTHLVQDILPGAVGSIPDPSGWDNGSGSYRPFVMNNILYFTASSPSRAYGLWRSDGTAAGTFLVNSGITFAPGGPFRYPSFCQLGNILYFAASPTTGDNELWRTDGTAAGTFRVKNISPLFDSEPQNLIAFNGAIYFQAWNENSGNELWKTDGTDAGTVLVKDFYTGQRGIMDLNDFGSKLLPWFTVSGNYLYFIGNANSSGTYKGRLYRTDGTEAGTIQLSTDVRPQEMTDVNGTLFFYGSNEVTNAVGLYKSDGTPAGTVPIPVNNHIVELPGTYQFRSAFHAFKNKLYFIGAQQPIPGTDTHLGMYQSDGTTAGTFLVNEMPLHDEGDRNTDFIDDATGSSFLWRSMIDIPSAASDTRVAQMDGTPGNYKIYYGATIDPGAAFFQGDLYFKGHDTTVSTGGFGLYKVHPTFASAPLPVIWLNFDALRNDAGGVDLHWQTAAESNNKGFTVERSTDGARWDSLVWVAGAGTSPLPHSYARTDEHSLPGNNFYRIRQTDFDGKTSYSATKKIEALAQSRLTVAPNPATDMLTIRHSLAPGRSRLEISDMAGRIVSSRMVDLYGGSLSWNVRNLKAGIYLLKLAPEGQASATCLFLKE